MKLYLVYKKRYLNHRGKTYGVILLMLFFIFTPFFSLAQNVQDLNVKISQRNSDINKLEQEIKTYQKQLDELGKQKNSLNISLKELDLNKKKLNVDIKITQKKIDKTNLKIQGLNGEISVKVDSIANNNTVIAFQIKQTNEFELNSLLETILSENDFKMIWNEIDEMASVQEKIRQKIVELKEIKSGLEYTRKENIDAKNELLTLKSVLADQRKIVEQNSNQKKNLLIQTKNNENNYQKLLKDRLVKKEAFEKELRDYESQLKYILDPSKLPGSGVLDWPLDKIYITQKFGKTEAGKKLYANGTHNGVDFRASIGTPVKAMANGVIAGTGDTDLQCDGVSLGRFVFIKYDDGLANAFGHLSLIKTKMGDRVNRGEIVGYSGNTGYSTGPHLHVSVYAKDAVELKTVPSKSCPGRVLTQPIAPINAYLDPLYYLPSLN